MLLVYLHAVSLEGGFLLQCYFPGLKRGQLSFEDVIVPLSPNFPGPEDKKFHEELMMAKLFSTFHHGMEMRREVPLDSQVIPAALAKRAGEEKMERCFLSVLCTQDTVVVISLQFMLLPFQNIPSI